MKFIIILLSLYSFLFAKVYYAKVEPYELRDISSNVSGLVLFADEESLGKKLSDKAYINIDTELDADELQTVQQKLVYMRETIKENEAILVNLKESLKRKRDNYKQIESLKIKSRVEKDKEFYDLVASENSYLTTQKEINNLKIQMADLSHRQTQLQRSIKDKNLSDKGFVLYSLSVKPGQFVGVSTPLAKIADVSKAVLTLYLDEEDVKNAQTRSIFIDDVATKYKISRIVNIADAKNISKYMAQIVIDAPELFSKLVKVEVKEEK
ncbi:MAG: HlyD family secretion protein [Sulfurimonas sp.]|nr:HlyD family secretion protein [Sulfurimonas sp.]